MALIQQVREHLSVCIDGLPRALCAFLATYDGHLIDLYAREELAIGENLPVASSILGLAQSLIAGLEPGARLDDVIVRSGERVISMVGIGDENNVLYVGIVAERMVNLGQMLVRGKACAEAIRALT
jgi:predicted regulator of Ras-like GTPase activity (Roadblock/LC7/MglB family)